MEPQQGQLEVLLVEDNAGDVRLLEEALHSATSIRFQVTTVDRLADAVRLLGERQFDVVLLDLTLPDRAGLDTLHATRDRVPAMP
ncbi:MAG: response regulator, partial [Gemmatimonadales bacterium]